MPAPCSFRPCRSSRLRRFPPLCDPQVCCTLQPVVGFVQFQTAPKRRPPLVRSTLRSVSLLGSLTASPGLPLFTAARALSSFPVFATRMPLPRARPQGLAPPRSPLQYTDVATRARSLLPWASGLTWPSVPSPARVPKHEGGPTRRKTLAHTPGSVLAGSRPEGAAVAEAPACAVHRVPKHQVAA